MLTRRFRWTFYLAAFVTLLLAATLVWIDQFLTSEVAPQGMISFELARTPDAARTIIDSWGVEGVEMAAWSLMLDFPFAIGYVVLFICLTLLTQPPLRSLFIGGFVIAGICDLLENLTLIQILAGNFSPTYTLTAFWCASVKFGLLVVGWSYLLLMGLYSLYQRLKNAGPSV